VRRSVPGPAQPDATMTNSAAVWKTCRLDINYTMGQPGAVRKVSDPLCRPRRRFRRRPWESVHGRAQAGHQRHCG
jgi:hypothetical protein